MKNLILILLAAASLSLSCAQPQKFEANLAFTNANINQLNSEISATPMDALIFMVFDDGKVFLQKNGKKELLGTTAETEKLRQSFNDLLEERENKMVSVQVPRGKYKHIEAVIDLLKSVGAKPVASQVEGLEQ